jgi:hypothetical protein
MPSRIPQEMVRAIMSQIDDIDDRRNLHLAWKGIFDIPHTRTLPCCDKSSSFTEKFSELPKVEFFQDVDFPPGSQWHRPDSYEVFLERKGFMYSIEYCDGSGEHHINGTRFCRNGGAHDTSYTLDMTENVWKSDHMAPVCGPGCQELRRMR